MRSLFALLKSFLKAEKTKKGIKDKLHSRRKYLQTKYTTKEQYIECINNSKSNSKKKKNNLIGK